MQLSKFTGRFCGQSKKVGLSIGFLLVASAPVQIAHAAWVDVSPAALVVDFEVSRSSPNILFATTVLGNTGAPGSQGIWRSINSGGNWEQVISGTDYDGVAMAPNVTTTVIAGVEGFAVQRSVTSGDNGSWLATAGGANEDSWIFSFSESTPSVVYAGGFTSGGPDTGNLQRSTNSGANWTSLSLDGDANAPVLSLAVDPKDSNTAYVGARPTGGLNDGLYKTIDGGANWSIINLTLSEVEAVAVDPVNSSIVYMGGGLGLIYRSTDGGSTWATVHDPSSGGVGGFGTVSSIAINPADRRIIYAAGGSGTTKVIVSTNCGASWSDVDSTGIVAIPKKVLIDSANNFVYVMEKPFVDKIYREALITSGSGTCPAGSGNTAPVAVDDMVNATEDVALVSGTDLDANDTDGDGDPLTVLPGVFLTMQGGSINIAADGSYTYTPTANFNGNDSVNYTVSDGSASDVGTLTIAVGAVDDPPVAMDDAIVANRNTVFNSATDLDANDLEVDGEALTVTAETKATAQAGSITIAVGGSYSYTPAFNYVGNDSVDYTVTDGISNDTGTLNITVAAGGGAAPVAVDDMVNATEDVALASVADLDANDTDGDGDPLFVTPGTFLTAQAGSIVIAVDGSYNYTPAANFNGNDSVNYTVTDGFLNDVGTLTIAVVAVDDPPVAVNDAIMVTADTVFNSTTDLDANDLEVDGEALTVMAEIGKATAQGGEIDIAADGSYSYMPALGYVGADSVDYTVMDAANNDVGTLNITVVAPAPAPAPAAPVGGGGVNPAPGASSGGGGSSFSLLFAGLLVLLGVLKRFSTRNR